MKNTTRFNVVYALIAIVGTFSPATAPCSQRGASPAPEEVGA